MNRRHFLAIASAGAKASPASQLSNPWPGSYTVLPGPINGVILTHAGRRLAIYGDPRPQPGAVDQVLLTHARRDVVWAASALQSQGASVIAPKGEGILISNPQAFWDKFETARYHDYATTNTKVPATAMPVERTVAGGDRITWQGLEIEVLDTPGYSPGAVSYLFTAGGKRVACVGDLIYGQGQLFDLFSLQDAVPEAKLRGYHGYAARAHELIASLRRIAATRPDVLIPARGPVIHQPAAAIEKLIERLKIVLSEHFQTDALRWYFGDDNWKLRAAKVMEGGVPSHMPGAREFPLPSWLVAIRNSRLLISNSGGAFLIDCGYDAVIEQVALLQSQGRFQRLEGIYITHYHDDHTDRAEACAERFQCPVYFSEELRDILENPGAYRMPCLSDRPIHRGKPMPHGARMPWHEFQLAFSYFPGQTLLHGSLTAKRESGETVVFVGDSFTPSGLDDYCLWNRNTLAPGAGYYDCLAQLRKLPDNQLLVNQHVQPAFRFSRDQLDFMEQSLHRRVSAMKALFPWPDINFGLDEQWVRLAPYALTATPGKPFQMDAVIVNHLPSAQDYLVRPVLPAGWKCDPAERRIRIPARSTQSCALRVTPPPGAASRTIISIDVDFGSWQLRRWAEAVVELRQAL